MNTQNNDQGPEKDEKNKGTVVNQRLGNALGTISKGGALVLFGGFIANGLGFLHQAAVAKYFGPGGLGVLALALMWVTIATRLSTGGLPSALKKFLPIHVVNKDNTMFNNTVFTVFLISLIICVPFSISLFVFSDFIAINVFQIKRLSPLLKVVAFVIPIQSLMVLVQQLFLALKDVKHKVLLQDVGFPLFRLFILGIIVLVGGSVFHVTFGYLLAGFLVVLLGSFVVEIKINKKFNLTGNGLNRVNFIPKGILRYSLPLLFSGALMIVMGKADTFMLGYFTSEASVGIYNLVLPIAMLLTIFLMSINQIFFPVISHLHADKKIEELSDTFSTVLRWDFLLTFPFFVFLVVFSRPLLQSFFPEYVSGWRALVILSVGMMFRAGLGPVGHTLETYGRTKFIFKVNSFLVLVNIGLNFMLIPLWGFEGAAVATAVAFSLNNIFEMWRVRRLFGFNVRWRCYLKYVVSAVIPAVLIYILLYFTVSNWWTLIIGGVVFLVLFFLLLLLMRSFCEKDIYLFEVIEVMLEKIGFKKVDLKKLVKRFI